MIQKRTETVYTTIFKWMILLSCFAIDINPDRLFFMHSLPATSMTYIFLAYWVCILRGKFNNTFIVVILLIVDLAFGNPLGLMPFCFFASRLALKVFDGGVTPLNLSYPHFFLNMLVFFLISSLITLVLSLLPKSNALDYISLIYVIKSYLLYLSLSHIFFGINVNSNFASSLSGGSKVIAH